MIENQLEKTDHDHLGKLVTYLSNLTAKIAIWITSLPRLEHITAMNWLNEISPADTSFFLVKVEAYTIGQSKDNWVTAGAGKSGMGWSYSITMDKGSVELFIDRGPDKKEETDQIYAMIVSDQEMIEKAFSGALEWDTKEGRRVCRIKSYCTFGGLLSCSLSIWL